MSSRGQRISEKRGTAQFISSLALTPHIHTQIVYTKFYIDRRSMFSVNKRKCVNCSLLMTHPKKVGGRQLHSFDYRFGATDLRITLFLSITMKTYYYFNFSIMQNNEKCIQNTYRNTDQDKKEINLFKKYVLEICRYLFWVNRTALERQLC